MSIVDPDRLPKVFLNDLPEAEAEAKVVLETCQQMSPTEEGEKAKKPPRPGLWSKVRNKVTPNNTEARSTCDAIEEVSRRRKRMRNEKFNGGIGAMQTIPEVDAEGELEQMTPSSL